MVLYVTCTLPDDLAPGGRKSDTTCQLGQLDPADGSDAEVLSKFIQDQSTMELYCSFFPSPSLKRPGNGNSTGSFTSYPFKIQSCRWIVAGV